MPKIPWRDWHRFPDQHPATALLLASLVLAVFLPKSLALSLPLWIVCVIAGMVRRARIRWHRPDFTPAGIICGWGEPKRNPRPRRGLRPRIDKRPAPQAHTKTQLSSP